MTPNRSSSPATDFSLALFDEYLRLGVRDVVVSPGSRSQALALVAAEYERRGLVRLRVRIDERVGGFLALGLAVETSTPVLIITTSGTAVANLHPAVLEAHHSGVPLIVLSADRPAELRGIGSNQTANQTGIFGAAITRAWDVEAPRGDSGEVDVAAALARDSFTAALTGHGGRPTPVHLNIGFREPLSGPIIEASTAAALTPAEATASAATASEATASAATAQVDVAPGYSAAATSPAQPFAVHVLHPHPGTVVVAGAGAGEEAEAVARELGVPLFAEVTSGAHFGPNLVVTYRELLREHGFGDRIARVIVFGHPTLSREIPALIARDDVTTTVVRTPGADDYNPGHRVFDFVDAVRVASADEPGEPSEHTGYSTESPAEVRAWLGRWVFASRALLEPAATDFPVDLSNADFARRQLGIVRAPVTRRMLVDAVWRSTWPHDRLVFGASRLIREADQIVPGKRIPVHANRGLAGIDGTIATAIGIALASQNAPAPAVAAVAPAIADAASPTSPSAAPEQRAPHTENGTTRVLLGDLTALHDVGALLFGVGEARPRVQVIVGNDGGGTIFDSLEVAQSTASEALDRVMLTAHTVDFEKLASAYGWLYLRVANQGELDEALAACPGPMLVEVTLAR